MKSPGADTVKAAFVNGVLPRVPVAVPLNEKVAVAAKALLLNNTTESNLCIKSSIQAHDRKAPRATTNPDRFHPPGCSHPKKTAMVRSVIDHIDHEVSEKFGEADSRSPAHRAAHL